MGHNAYTFHQAKTLDYFLYLIVGALAGFLSGLFGLGGGVIIVPVLIFMFTASNLSIEVVTHLAIGTSLATIAITSITSALTHHQKGAVRWDLIRWIVPGIVFGSVIGGLVAASLAGYVLQLLFGCLLVVVSAQLFLSPEFKAVPTPGRFFLGLAGTFIGSVSALFGIGGGTLTTPFLTRIGVKIRQAVGSAAACGLPIAVAGGLTYLVAGQGNSALPEGSLGYIYIPAWIGIVLASIPFARLGALVAHLLNEQILRRLFAAVILLLGIRFIWINALISLG